MSYDSYPRTPRSSPPSQDAERRRRDRRIILTTVGTVTILLLGWALWAGRPLLHGLLMLGMQWPLLTVVPIGIGLLVAVVVGAVLYVALDEDEGPYLGCMAGGLAWLVSIIVMALHVGGWQDERTLAASNYTVVSELPGSTQARLLPKDAAERYARGRDLQQAHLVVNPESGDLSWSAELAPAGFWNRLWGHGSSKQVALMGLDRIDGVMQTRDVGFSRAVTSHGSGSLNWRAWKRHFVSRVTDPVIVPLADGKVVAVTPYLGYRGTLVRRAYWKGVYVLHQDGRLEDLTPRQAQARPELARSGRLYPEDLARQQANAYARAHGAEVRDPEYLGNPQPYLTKLSSGRVVWVAVTSPKDHPERVADVLMTDSTTGRTEVWHAGERDLLSGDGAARLARRLKMEWTRRTCCDANGYEYDADVRWVSEPRLVFQGGRPMYLVSIVADGYLLKTPWAVDKTVLIDASEHSIVKVYDHTRDDEADDRLRVRLSRDGPDS